MRFAWPAMSDGQKIHQLRAWDDRRHGIADPSTRGDVTRWTAERPHTLVVACSDGRLQEATDAFLGRELGLTQFDRFYVPGGGGALSASGRDFIRAQQLRRECAYLIELHSVAHVVLLFHGPAADGPPAAVCADYRRKMSWASPDIVLARQLQDSAELIGRKDEWAGQATVASYRCEVYAGGEIGFRVL
jgi:hypothetical protein